MVGEGLCFDALERPTLDANALRAALRAVVGPVTIVTTLVDGRPWGLTVSAFTPVCFEPPTMLVCVNRSTATASAIVEQRTFGINVLSESQVALSRRSAAPGTAKFLDTADLLSVDRPDPFAPPLLRDSLISFECVAEHVEVGTHLVVFGRVQAMFATPSDRPLLYGRGDYQRAIELHD